VAIPSPEKRVSEGVIRLHYENDLSIGFWQRGLLNGNHVRCVPYNTRILGPGNGDGVDPSRKYIYHLENGTDPAIYRSDLRIDGDGNQEFLPPMIQMLHPPTEHDRDRPLPYRCFSTFTNQYQETYAQTLSVGSQVLKLPS
jgi:hypothetical protein